MGKEQLELGEGWNDAANFRRMQEPHETVDAANAALLKFAESVDAARKESRLSDVTILVQTNLIEETGQESTAFVQWHFGDTAHALPMMARAYGASLAKHEEEMRDYMELGRLITKKKSKRDIRTTGHTD